MKICKFVAAGVGLAVLLSVSANAYAQPGGGFPGGGGWGQQSTRIFTLMRPDVRDELELVDDQLEKLRDLQRQLREETQEIFAGMRGRGRDAWREAADEVREKMESLSTEFDRKLDDVLLPMQRDRLDQIVLQQRIRMMGPSRALASDDVAKKLNITDEQRQKMIDVAREAQEELREKTAQLQHEARDKVLDVLTDEQRAEYQRLMGERFEGDPRRGFGEGFGRRFGRQRDGDSDSDSDRDRD